MSDIKIILKHDVYRDVTVEPINLRNAIYAGDSAAQRLMFRCWANHGSVQPDDLSQKTVTAHFIRPDGGDVVITGVGGAEWSYVDLPEACYVYPGIFKLLVRVSSVDPDVVTSVMYIVGRIDKPTTDTIIDPGTTIPSLEDLLAMIDSMEDARDEATAAAAFVPNIIAPAYSASATYPVGDYVTNDGKLYRCIIPITTAGSEWGTVSGNFQQVNVVGEMIGLTNAFNAVDHSTGVRHAAWENHVKINTPAAGETATLERVGRDVGMACVLDIEGGEVLHWSGTGGTTVTGTAWCFVDSDNKVLARSGTSLSGEYVVMAPEGTKKVILNNRNDADNVYAYVGETTVKLHDSLDIHRYETSDTVGCRYAVWEHETRIRTPDVGETATFVRSAYVGNLACVIDIEEGELLHWTGTGGGNNTGLAWCFLDANDVVLARSAENLTGDYVVIAPRGTKKAILNNRYSADNICAYVGETYDERTAFTPQILPSVGWMWKSGRISDSGANASDSTKIRTYLYLKIYGRLRVKVPLGYKIKVFVYTGTTYTTLSSVSDYYTETFFIQFDRSVYCRFMISATDESAEIVPDAANEKRRNANG